MIHELKIQKQWADAKLVGEKPFEIRRNDRGFQKGDIVRYTVVDPKTGEPWKKPSGEILYGNDDGHHQIEQCDFIITYVREGADGLEKGFCVYADQPVPKKVAKDPAGVRLETFHEGFIRHTQDRLGGLEMAVKALGSAPKALCPGECDRYEPDESFLVTGEKPCRHHYHPPAEPNAAGSGLCTCPGCIHCGHTCPTGGTRIAPTVEASPVSADLRAGATPSNGTETPLAPPSPLAEIAQ